MSIQKPQPQSEFLTLTAVELVSEDSPRFQEEFGSLSEALGAREVALNDPTRSKAFIKFTLCHSLPTVNANGAAWTLATLKNSVCTIEDQLIDLNHLVGENAKKVARQKGMFVASTDQPGTHDRFIGLMKFGEVAAEGDNEHVPSQAVPIVVTGVLWKRSAIVQQILANLAAGKPVKVSMECEFEQVAYWHEGGLYEPGQNADLDLAIQSGKRDLNGKPIARVLGGINGTVNFHGAAILLDENPADPGAEIKAAVAQVQNHSVSEFGGAESTMEINDIASAPVHHNDSTPTTTPASTYAGPADGLTGESLEKGYEAQVADISALQSAVAKSLNMLEKIGNKLFGKAAVTPDDWQEVVTAPLPADAPPLDPNTPYADPGFLGDKTPRWPLRTKEEVLAAAHHFTQPQNLVSYTDFHYLNITDNIINAAARLRIELPSVLMTASVPKEPIAQSSAGGSSGTNQEDNPAMTIENQQAAQAATDAAAAATTAAAAATESARALTQQVEDLRSSNEALMTELQAMRNAESERAKKERTNFRKKFLAEKFGELDEETCAHLAPHLENADDDSFNRMSLLLTKVFSTGLSKGAATAAAEPAQAISNPAETVTNAPGGEQLPSDKNFVVDTTPAGPNTLPGEDTTNRPGGEALPTDKNFPGNPPTTSAPIAGQAQANATPIITPFAPTGAAPDYTPAPGERARNKFHALG